jgi:hypothetical protein
VTLHSATASSYIHGTFAKPEVQALRNLWVPYVLAWYTFNFPLRALSHVTQTKSLIGRAIAQAVSRWLPNATARVHFLKTPIFFVTLYVSDN